MPQHKVVFPVRKMNAAFNTTARRNSGDALAVVTKPTSATPANMSQRDSHGAALSTVHTGTKDNRPTEIRSFSAKNLRVGQGRAPAAPTPTPAPAALPIPPPLLPAAAPLRLLLLLLFHHHRPPPGADNLPQPPPLAPPAAAAALDRSRHLPRHHSDPPVCCCRGSWCLHRHARDSCPRRHRRSTTLLRLPRPPTRQGRASCSLVPACVSAPRAISTAIPTRLAGASPLPPPLLAEPRRSVTRRRRRQSRRDPAQFRCYRCRRLAQGVQP